MGKEITNPLHFHEIHGQEINLLESSLIASRSKGSRIYNGIVFSHRPIRLQIGEKVTLKIVAVNSNWKGHLWLGFTNRNPSSLTSPQLYNSVTYFAKKKGWWMKLVPDECIIQNGILTLSLKPGVDKSGNKIELKGIGKMFHDPNFLEHVNPNPNANPNDESLWFCAYLRGKMINIQLIETPTLTQSLIAHSRFLLRGLLKSITDIFWILFYALFLLPPQTLDQNQNQNQDQRRSESNSKITAEIRKYASVKPCEDYQEADEPRPVPDPVPDSEAETEVEVSDQSEKPEDFCSFVESLGFDSYDLETQMMLLLIKFGEHEYHRFRNRNNE